MMSIDLDAFYFHVYNNFHVFMVIVGGKTSNKRMLAAISLHKQVHVV